MITRSDPPTTATFEEKYANVHGQSKRKQTEQDAREHNSAFIELNLAKGTRAGLGYAMHGTEDPFAYGHRFTEYEDMSLSETPYWIVHGFFDFVVPLGFFDALSADRQLIQRYQQLSGRKDACQ
jgi:hypothetical protein